MRVPALLRFAPALLLGASIPWAWGQEMPKAARSVHLHYPAPAAELFYNEVVVEESVPGTYFSVCGFGHGYFGIQQLTGGRPKVAIFSVWEPGPQDDPNSVPADRRVELISKGEGVRTGRFGGEGTGGQSFLDFDWKVGETHRFLVSARPEGMKTTFTAHIYLPDKSRWQQMAAFRTLTKGSHLTGLYSFVEDFRRDTRSFTEVRRARFGNGWVRLPSGEWQSLTRARFTADSTILTDNIDARPLPGGPWFQLSTGGGTRNSRKLNDYLERNPLPVPLP